MKTVKGTRATSSLPPLYDRWLRQALAATIPDESRATCGDCPLCSRDPERNLSERTFGIDTKCCTYRPDLPNFLVGRILRDGTPALASGRRTLERELGGAVIVTPFGVRNREEYWAKYRSRPDAFGMDVELRCSYFQPDLGHCGIWQHRNARCATWFCKFEHGSRSVIFWKYADELLTTIENKLSVWSILQLDIGADALEALFPTSGSDVDVRRLTRLWGNWRGREREFFVASIELVEALDWRDVARIGGVDLERQVRLVRHARRRLASDPLPEMVKRGDWKKVTPGGADGQRIWAYNVYDPIDVAGPVAERLLQAGMEPFSRSQEPKLPARTVRTLLDFGVLVAAEKTEA